MKSARLLLVLALVGGALGTFWLAKTLWAPTDSIPNHLAISINLEQEGLDSNWELVDFDLNTKRFVEWKNKSIVINFWASWCGPCEAEFPHFIHAAQELPATQFILVSADEDKEQAQIFLKNYPSLPTNLNIFWDPNQDLLAKFGTTVLPETYLFDADHKLVKKVVGLFDMSVKDIQQLFL